MRTVVLYDDDDDDDDDNENENNVVVIANVSTFFPPLLSKASSLDPFAYPAPLNIVVMLFKS